MRGFYPNFAFLKHENADWNQEKTVFQTINYTYLFKSKINDNKHAILVINVTLQKQLFLDSRKRFHAIGMRNSDSPHKITPKEIISR